MKVKIDETDKKEEIKYPCLMISDYGTIILMYENGFGVCLATSSDAFSVGNATDKWDMSMFKPFKGSVTLSND